MLSSASRIAISRASSRAFSTSASRSADLAKLILIGRLGKDPELRFTKNNKEYVQYTVATTNYPPPPPSTDGCELFFLPHLTRFNNETLARVEPKTTWHTILSFSPAANNYLRHLSRGSQVFVEANFELREPDPSADPDTPQGQRQIFLRHESIRLLKSSGTRTATDEEGVIEGES
ncbi:hypothetical protein AcV7_008316 [Taiwanofungus camphoratus]|nr:hypothetical protein AcV7_008316 [Antrodia cinnamomea]